jgi:hypothetical protein
MGRVKIEVPRDKIAEFCRKHHIRKLALFGSVLREDFRPDSDVDVLVEFEPEHVPGFLHLYDIEQTLSDLLGGYRVDLITEKFLNRRIRHHVLADAEVQYAEG